MHIELKKENIPVEYIGEGRCSIVVQSDSIKVGNTFRSFVEINEIELDHLKARCHFTGVCYSKGQLYQGDLYSNVEIRGKTTYIKDISIYQGSNSSFRNIFIKKIKSRVSSGLLLGLLIGDKSLMENHIIELFRKTGTSHILALSGFHLGLITLIVLILLKPFITGNIRYYITNLIIFFYIFITGISPSLFRAFIMLQLITLFKVKKLHIEIVDIISLSFFISIILRPEDFNTVSFKLSYLALYGVIIVGGLLIKFKPLSIMPITISNSITASIGAILLTSPFILHTFGKLYPVGIIASLILTPIIVIYIWIGILSILIKPLQSFIFVMDECIFKLASLLSKCPYLDNNKENSLVVSLIFISLPVILYFTTLLRRKDVRRFNSKFKL